jgi:hypothetical protein
MATPRATQEGITPSSVAHVSPLNPGAPISKCAAALCRHHHYLRTGRAHIALNFRRHRHLPAGDDLHRRRHRQPLDARRPASPAGLRASIGYLVAPCRRAMSRSSHGKANLDRVVRAFRELSGTAGSVMAARACAARWRPAGPGRGNTGRAEGSKARGYRYASNTVPVYQAALRAIDRIMPLGTMSR